MDLEALRHTALGPYRWRRTIENHHAYDSEESANLTELEPIATTKIWASSSPSGGIRLLFVPGGRFLLTAVENSLRLWDVGPVGEERPLGPQILRTACILNF
jgi:hypothetical protein